MMLPPHKVVIVAFPPVQMLDVAGPMDALAAANRIAEQSGSAPPFQVLLASPGGGSISTTAGVPVNATLDLFGDDWVADTVIFAGGPGIEAAISHPRVMEAVHRLCQATPRVAAFSTGAFVLAAAGVLTDRHATTHWAHLDELKSSFPQLRVEQDALFIVDGKFHTSAGICSAIDYILTLIQHDLGNKIALQVARELVVFLRRPGGQSQFSAHLAVEFGAKDADRFGELTRWLEANLGGELSVDIMADKMAMSPRNFARRFKEVMNVTPNAYLQLLRVDAARRLLSGSNLSIARVAKQCGFASATAFRTEFQAHVNSSPEDFRTRFRLVEGRYCYS